MLQISPISRQKKYLMESQAATKGGKFITTIQAGIADPDAPSDIVNRAPPRDGQIASAGNPYAFKLDAVRDEYGNEWSTDPVRSGEAFTFTLDLGPVKVRRVTVYITKANWDSTQVLTRAQVDLHSPVYQRTYPAAPYHAANDELPAGLVANQPMTISFNLPNRTVGHHVLLLEVDHPDSTDALYQIIDLRYL